MGNTGDHKGTPLQSTSSTTSGFVLTVVSLKKWGK